MAHTSYNGVLSSAGLGEGALLLGTSAQRCLRAKGQVGIAETLLDLENIQQKIQVGWFLYGQHYWCFPVFPRDRLYGFQSSIVLLASAHDKFISTRRNPSS